MTANAIPDRPIQEPAARSIDSAQQTATRDRLEYLINWYEKHARREGNWYKGLKVVAIAAAAAVSVLATTSVPPVLVASLGGLVVVLEGVQQLFQFHTNSVSYATTKELLKREKALFEGGAGTYAAPSVPVTDPDRVLAERIEAIAAKELEAWMDSQRNGQAKP